MVLEAVHNILIIRFGRRISIRTLIRPALDHCVTKDEWQFIVPWGRNDVAIGCGHRCFGSIGEMSGQVVFFTNIAFPRCIPQVIVTLLKQVDDSSSVVNSGLSFSSNIPPVPSVLLKDISQALSSCVIV